MKQSEEIVIGACYYPEHWDKKYWETDLKRMLVAGIQVIRIAEFAWNKIEVRENIFEFDFFDEFMDLVEKTPMKVIFSTPTATPPAWLTNKYPEVLCVDHDGKQHKHGMRRQYNYNSPVYLEKTSQIVEEIAGHFGKRRSIIGWQIDNELNCVTDEFYSDPDHKAFRVFLKNKYKTLDRVNEAWGTVFWNQEYSKWDDIYLPRHAPRKTANPHLRLDAIRFFSDSACRYCKLQSDILRRYIPEDVFITTNGIFKHIDYKKMVSQSLDMLTYDSYPTFGLMDPQNEMKDRKWSMNLARVRASSNTFGIMEQQSGPGGWVNHHKAPTPKPGQIRLWTYQSLAHGADFISYFRWRTAVFGTELYWYGILGHDNRDNQRLEEVKRVTGEMKKLKEIAGSRYRSAVAVLYDYDNEWDAEYDVWWGPLYQYSQTNWFQALQMEHIPFDYLTIQEETLPEDLQKYSCLILPHMAIVKTPLLAKLKEYVRKGGTIIAGARTGFKDCYGKCPMEIEPVSMNDLFGINIHDFTLLAEENHIQYGKWGNELIEMNLFHDILTPITESCEIKAVYTEDYYKDQPAITFNSYGEGTAVYVGSAFGVQTARTLIHKLKISAPCGEKIDIPEACELAIRERDGKEYVFILNYSAQEQTLIFKTDYFDLITGKEILGERKLQPYDVLVLNEKERII